MIRRLLVGLAGLGLAMILLLRGKNVALLQPKGFIAQEQNNLMFYAVGLMLVVAIPTLALFYLFAWRYRETNRKAAYKPDARHGILFMLVLWAIPTVVVVLLAARMWTATHKLEPHKPIGSSAKTLTIQVVALRWKWVFIYPEQDIATVNFVQIPVGTPVEFELTADEAPMSSFWIPNLGGQLYAMTGHVNRLNLVADTAGDYPGRSAEINGEGFAGMTFTARASSQKDFDKWVRDTRKTSGEMDDAEYKSLLAPSENNTPKLYSEVAPNLYDIVLKKYNGSHHTHTEPH